MKSARAKVLHELAGRPLAYFPVKRALELGADRVVVVVGHQAEAVEAALRAALPGAPLRFALQARQLGTAHAVLQARRALRGHGGPVLILSGDMPLLTAETLGALVSARPRPSALALATMVPDSPRGYGRVVRDDRGRPCASSRRRTRPTPSAPSARSTPASTASTRSSCGGRWAGCGSSNAQGEFYLPDLVAMAADRGRVAAVEVPVAERRPG